MSAVNQLVSVEEKIIKVATFKDYAPFCMTGGEYDVNQNIPVGENAIGFKGHSWDILHESLHEMGYTIHLSIMPWVRALKYVKSDRANILFPTVKKA